MASSIAISRLRAKHRKTRRQGGSLGLVIDTPATDPIRFRATQRVGRAFKLLKAGPLPERFVGGLRTGASAAFGPEADGGQPELNRPPQACRKGHARSDRDGDQRPPSKGKKTMTQIYKTDSAVIRLLQDCNFPGVNVASGPHSLRWLIHPTAA